MATRIIDALLVTLGLDSSGFNQGAGEVDRSLNRTRKTVVDVSRDIERAINGAARSLALAFLGFNSASGLVRSIAQMNELARQIGLIGQNTGTAARELKKYANAAEIAGGSSEGLLDTIKKIKQQQYEARTYGVADWTRFANSFRELGTDWAMREPLDVLNNLAEMFERVSGMQGRPIANQLGLDMGINQDTMNFLLRGPQAIKEFVAKQDALTRGYDGVAKSAEQLRERWRYLKQQGEMLGLTLLQQLQPQLIKLADWLTKISSEGVNSGQWAQGIVDGVKSITEAVKELWKFVNNVADRFEKLGETRIGKFILKNEEKKDSGFIKVPNSLSDVAKLIPGTWQNTRAQYIDRLTKAEEKYQLPPGTLSAIVQKQTGWNKDVLSGRSTTRAGGTGLFGLNPQRFPGAGQSSAGDAELVSDILDRIFGQTGDWTQTIRQFQKFAYPGQKEIGEGTVLKPIYDFNPMMATRGAAPVGAGTVLRDGNRSFQNTLQIDALSIYTQATDAAGIAAAAESAIRRRLDAAQADYGMD